MQLAYANLPYIWKARPQPEGSVVDSPSNSVVPLQRLFFAKLLFPYPPVHIVYY